MTHCAWLLPQAAAQHQAALAAAAAAMPQYAHYVQQYPPDQAALEHLLRGGVPSDAAGAEHAHHQAAAIAQVRHGARTPACSHVEALAACQGNMIASRGKLSQYTCIVSPRGHPVAGAAAGAGAAGSRGAACGRRGAGHAAGRRPAAAWRGADAGVHLPQPRAPQGLREAHCKALFRDFLGNIAVECMLCYAPLVLILPSLAASGRCMLVNGQLVWLWCMEGKEVGPEEEVIFAAAGLQPDPAVLLQAQARHRAEGLPALQDHRRKGKRFLLPLLHHSSACKSIDLIGHRCMH